MKDTNRIVLVMIFFFPVVVWAQCPSVISATAATTDASCPSSGSATITTSPAANSSFRYSITSGPSGVLLNTPQISNVFNALQPGNYTVQVSCGATLTDVSFNIQDNYSPIMNVNAAVSVNCSSYSPGATVNISVTGGSAPFAYSIVKSNDPNYADASSIYTSSPNKTVTSFGTYQVRVKDACNQFYTVTKQISPSLNPVIMACSASPLTGCNPAYYNFYCQLLDAVTNSEIDSAVYNALGGVKLRVFEQAPGSCAPTGPLLLELTPAPTHSQITVPVVPSNKYFLQTITPCGDTLSNCIDAYYFYNPYFQMATSVEGCGSVGNPFIESIRPYNWGGIVFPLSVSLYRGTSTAGGLVGTKISNSDADMYLPDTLVFKNLTPDTYYIRATDACGNIFTQLIDDPTAAGAPSLVILYGMTPGCAAGAGVTTQSGTGSFAVGLQGFLADLNSATATIISGPGSIGVTGYKSGNAFIWIDLLPGTYTAAVTTTCGTINLQFTVPNNSFDILSQNIAATSSSTCGAGSGSVTATTDYNGGLSPVFILTDALTKTAVDSNKTGLFTTVTPGQYYVRMKLSSDDAYCGVPAYYINSNTVAIAEASTGPQVIKKLGLACEDINGNPISTGSAYLSVAGSTPLLVEYKLTSASSWTTFSSNAPATFEIAGLSVNNIYDIRITSCGITTATQVTVAQLGYLHAVSNDQPCVGNLFELALQQFPGASYEWKNPSGNIISTAYNYTFPSYAAFYNGDYVGIVSWGNCIKRRDTISLNSTLCGSLIILPVKLLSFTARTQNCATTLKWKISDGSSLKSIDVERSTNSKDYTTIANTTPDAIGTYTDESIFEGVIYYRLKMTTIDGRYSYSKPIIVKTNCNSANTEWVRYPALVKSGDAVTVKLNTSNSISTKMRIVVTSITGQNVHTQEVPAHKGQNIYTLQGLTLTPGIYLVILYDSYLLRIGSAQKLIVTK